MEIVQNHVSDVPHVTPLSKNCLGRSKRSLLSDRAFCFLLQFPLNSQNVSVGEAGISAFDASLAYDAASAIFIKGQL
jgi:hypothetical protein